MRTITHRFPSVLLSALLILLSTASSTQAQYFGRNKVHYKDFTFEVLKTEHFDIYFYDEERDSAARVGRMAERWYARLSQALDHEMRSRQPLVLYASHPDFEQTNVVGGEIGEGTGGVTESLKRRVILPMAGTLAETDHVLGHELVHAFQYDIASRRPPTPDGTGGGGSIESLPLWFIEGMAEYLSIGPVDAHTAMWIRDAARKETLPAIKDLDDPDYFPYRWGQALWAYVGGTWGDDLIPQIYRDALRSGNLELALRNATTYNEKELSDAWHAAIHEQYDPILKAATRARTVGSALTAQDRSKLATNVSPSISPDGRRVVYFSSRDMLSIGLYLAETANGRVVRKLVDSALDHFTSLQFIGSAGSWKPDSRQFVVAAVRSGKAELVILNVDTGDVVQEIPFPEVGEILNPSWSPDGRFIAFSATVGGDSDLFVHDLETAATKRLTSDAFADLQPAWSPDGRTIAFVTDRFTTRLENLQPGPYQLAVFDVALERIEPLRTFTQGKNINPQWNPDGRHLYFVSDRNGISNVYVLDMATGGIAQVTDLDSGVSGITALSPVISSALDARKLAMSAYEDGSYHVYLIDSPHVLAGSPLVGPYSRLEAAGLPPAQRESFVAQLLSDDTTGLPLAAGSVEPYRARLSLDAVGQPYISAGVGRFGGGVGGGLSFNFSDILGNHNLFAQVGADTSGTGLSDMAKNTSGLVAYTNLAHRVNWGVSVEQTPYIAGGYSSGRGTVNNQAAQVDETIIQRQVYRGANGLVAYPLSHTRRIEFGTGFSQISYDQRVRTVATSLSSGRIISDETTTTALASTLNMSSVNAALVSDRTVFGATSPVAGHRSRIEIAPTFGSVRYTTGLVDYRRYFMPARFYTIAGRVLHYGRYGASSEDSRLIPLFVGYPEFVRGYGIGSFQTSECLGTTCPTFERLTGSRMLVSNLEFRFPLLRPFGLTDRMYGPLPVEVAFFLDSGVAWNRGQKPTWFNGDRKPISSGGLTLRTSLMGFAIAQIDLAKPFDRPGRGWVWGFSLTPGF